MAKVHVNGEVFEYDRSKRPLAEMIALESALKTTAAVWEDDLAAGSARALAGFIWLVWRRNGREVSFADIESGAVEIDRQSFSIEDDEPPDPTTEAGQKEASATTPASTSRRSASSASGPGR